MMDSAGLELLARVESLMREMAELREGQRRSEDSQRRIETLLERRRVDADRVYERRHVRRDGSGSSADDPRTIHGSSANDPATIQIQLVPPEVSFPHTPILPTPLPEKQKQSASDEKPSEFAGYLTGEWPDIKQPSEYERRAQAAFPGVSLAAEARKARGWECSNPKNTKRNHGRFLWGWLTRAQDNASRTTAPIFHIDALAKARADELADKQRRATQSLIEKQQAERPDRTSPEEAKKRLDLLKNTVLLGMGSKASE